MTRLCVIFDLDGTLVDSEVLNCRAFVESFPKITESADVLAARYRGMKLADITADISKRYALSIPEGFQHTYREMVRSLYSSSLSENPGVSDMLHQLVYPRCVASSAPIEKIVHALQVTSLSEFFGANLFSSYEIGSWKPDPSLFLHAASTMGFSPASCVVIEDSALGVEAGIAAGMHVCHYRGKGDANGHYWPLSEMTEIISLLEDIRRTI